MDILRSIRDPRYYQILVLGLLLGYGIVVLEFGVRWQNAFAVFSTALGTQLLASRLLSLPRFDPLSPIITSLSLTLLLRTDLLLISAIAALIAIGSKFLLRVRGKHIFNPANIAIVTLVLLSDHAWVSTGQWGSATLGALALASLGILVLTRAKRAETTIAFLLAYGCLLFGRALWLGDPLSIPLHQIQNGALLIFSFFMISDPRTAPDTPMGRSLFACLVAVAAFVIQFVFYIPQGPVFALILCAPLVPLMDHLLRGRRYQWLTTPSGEQGVI